MRKYAQRIRALRKEHKKSQVQIAGILGISQTMYSRYEREENELPVRHLIGLSQYYNVSSDYILGLSDIKMYRP